MQAATTSTAGLSARNNRRRQNALPAPDPAGGKNIKTHQRKKKKSKACRYAGFCDARETPCASRHSSGPRVAPRLGAAYPPAKCGTTPKLAYLALLRAEIARFTRYLKRLVSVALILTLYALRRFQWAAVSCCAVLCSPDVPPVRGFPPCTSGGLAGFTSAYCRSNQPQTSNKHPNTPNNQARTTHPPTATQPPQKHTNPPKNKTIHILIK